MIRKRFASAGPGAQRPQTVKLVANPRLREYVQERLSGQVRRPDETPVPGPATAPWTGRNQPHRGDRRWVQGWSPQPIANRLDTGEAQVITIAGLWWPVVTLGEEHTRRMAQVPPGRSAVGLLPGGIQVCHQQVLK
jgi:hypothetical protein